MNPWGRKESRIFSSDALILFIKPHNKSSDSYNPLRICKSWRECHSYSWNLKHYFPTERKQHGKEGRSFVVMPYSYAPAALEDKSAYLVVGFPTLTATRDIHSQQSYQYILWYGHQCAVTVSCKLWSSHKRTTNDGVCLMVWKTPSAMERVYFILTLARAYRLSMGNVSLNFDF